jgi:parvulin-like peptidyl-prolyl isomerase
MKSLDQVTALHIEGTSFSLATVLRFANMQGRFSAIEDYASNVLIAAYAQEHQLTASQEELQKAINDWRVENELYQASEVEDWLAERSLSISDLADHARMKILKDRVREHVASGKVERYFTEQRSEFDAVAIAQIVVNERGLARELTFKAQEGTAFFLLAREYSMDEQSRLAGGFVGRRERKQLPRAIAAQAFGLVAGTVIGPLEFDKQFYVIKVDDVYPADRNAEIRSRIEELLFEEWLSSRLKQASVHIPLWGQDQVIGDTVNDGDN